MPVTETREARIRFGTEGIETLKTADRALDNLQAKTGLVGAQQGRLADLQRLGGERMAKYGTSVGMLSGQMQQLGVQNDLIARGFSVGTDLLTGMMGPIGLAIAGVGTLATIIANLATEQERYNAALLSGSTDALVRYADRLDAVGSSARSALAAVRELKQERMAEIRAELAQTDATIMAGASPALGSFGLDAALHALGGGFQALASRNTPKLVAAVNARRKALLDELSRLEGAPEMMGPPESAMIATSGGAAGAGGGAAGRKTLGGFNIGSALGSYVAQSAFDSAVRPRLPELDVTPAVDPWIAGQDAMAQAAERMASRTEAAYKGIGGAAIGMQTAVSTITMKLLQGENLQRLKGLQVARYVSAETTAALLRGLAEYASGKMAVAIAELAEAIGNPLYWGLVPARSAAVGKWALAVGVLGGAAAAVSASAQGALGKNDAAGVSQASGTDVAGSAQGGLGTRFSSAAAAPTTIQYNFMVSYHGSVVYGQGGTRDWFYSELVPLFREAREIGALN